MGESVSQWQLGLVVAMAMAAAGAAAVAQEAPGLELGVSADYFGKYIWRGQNLQDDGVFQPSAGFSYGSLSGAIWGSLELSDQNNSEHEFTEVDYSLDWTDTLMEGVTYSVGVIYYDFPNTTLESTTEIYAGLGFDLPLSPSVFVYRDVDESDGTYVSVGVGHSFENVFEIMPDVPVGIELGASLGWGSENYNQYYWGVNDSALNDLAFTMAFPMEIGGWSVTPSLNYVTLVDGDIQDSDLYDTSSDYFFAGVSLSTSF